MMKKSVQSLVVTLLPQKSLGSSLIRKPHLLLPPLMMMSRTHHLKTLPSFNAPSNVKSDNDGRKYLHKSTFDEIRADLKRRKFPTAIADRYIRGALVRLAFHRDGEILIRLPGTIMRSDGIIATCASRLSFLETSKQLKDIKVDVDFRMGVRREWYEGVLLDGDLCSNIAFVRIIPRRPIPLPVFAKTGDLFSGRGLVASSCVTDSESCLMGSLASPAGCFSDDCFFMNCSGLGCPKPSDSAGRFNGNAIANEEENSESSRQIIKACVRIRHGTTAIGGCLVVPGRGVVGIIHHEDHFTHQIEATPVDLIVKHLEGIASLHERF